MPAVTISKRRVIVNRLPAGWFRLSRKVSATRRIYEYTKLDCAVRAENPGDVVVRNASFTLSYYQRLMQLGSSRWRHRLYSQIDGYGTARLQRAVERGRGVVLVSCHLGDFDVAGAWLCEVLGITPVVIAEPAGIVRHHLFDQARRGCGVVVRRPNETDAKVLARDIESGRLVLVMVDRRSRGRSERLTFLGHEIAAPHIALSLATATGASLICGATWRAGLDRTVVWVGREIPAEDVGMNGVAAYQNVVDDLTAVVRRSPEQFHVPADIRQMSWTFGAASEDLDPPIDDR